MSEAFYAVCGITEIDGKILLVRHAYGVAKDRILLPGGYVKEGEMPTSAIEREILEETGIQTKARSLIAAQFKPDQWCMVFTMDYLSGQPRSDGRENSEVLLLSPEEAVERQDITNLSRVILTTYKTNDYVSLRKSGYVARTSTAEDYVLFGV